MTKETLTQPSSKSRARHMGAAFGCGKPKRNLDDDGLDVSKHGGVEFSAAFSAEIKTWEWSIFSVAMLHEKLATDCRWLSYVDDEGMTALHNAFLGGANKTPLDTLKAMIDYVSIPHSATIRDRQDRMPLYVASLYEHRLDAIKLLAESMPHALNTKGGKEGKFPYQAAEAASDPAQEPAIIGYLKESMDRV